MNENFLIYTDVSCIPAKEYQMYLEEGFSGICTGGTAVLEVFSVRRQINVNDLINILPLQMVSIHSKSEDFSMTFFKVDKNMFFDVMSGIGKITPHFFFCMRKNFLFHLDVKDAERYLGFCKVLGFRSINDDPDFRRETILHLLRIYYWDFYIYFKKEAIDNNSLINSNKEKLAFSFAMYVFEYHMQHRSIAFYADKLCISPLYLTKVVQEVYGQSAHEMITDYVIVEIKKMLRNTNLAIKDILKQSGFSNQSSLSRFFRRYTGMSPSEYRKKIHVII